MPDDPSRQDLTLQSIVEGKKMEAYVEHRAKDMKVCWLCGTVSYRKLPMKNVGTHWVCIDCFRQIREIIINMDKWEAEIQLEKELSKKVDEGFGI